MDACLTETIEREPLPSPGIIQLTTIHGRRQPGKGVLCTDDK